MSMPILNLINESMKSVKWRFILNIIHNQSIKPIYWFNKINTHFLIDKFTHSKTDAHTLIIVYNADHGNWTLTMRFNSCVHFFHRTHINLSIKLQFARFVNLYVHITHLISLYAMYSIFILFTLYRIHQSPN